ncbi:MAG TPA: class I SAM-dependent methyltransferase [Chloroflexi bacterium]|nr:class I SAM-dependent methyltransferase [Chloroflexota bacterium]
MNEIQPDWYRRIWTLDIKEMSWVEETAKQIDFLIRTMNLDGSERVLDLACGFGRHSLALAERGFRVVGVDITPAYVQDAAETARRGGLSAEFICADIRDIQFEQEFDVVLNLADGAIGYLENDEENLRIFDRISAALRPGGETPDGCLQSGARRDLFPQATLGDRNQSPRTGRFRMGSRDETNALRRMGYPLRQAGRAASGDAARLERQALPQGRTARHPGGAGHDPPCNIQRL